MTSPKETSLRGLEGTNPAGYLAALGVLTVMRHAGLSARLSWTTDVLPTARLSAVASLEEIVSAVLDDRDRVLASPALTFPVEGEPLREVKFDDPAKTAAYLRACRDAADDGLSEEIAAMLVPEVSVDRSGKAKPSDLHFTAGQQRLVEMARELGAELSEDDVVEALQGPWTYTKEAPSFMWDVADDRVYALGGANPAAERKATVPGSDWLAFRGWVALPVVGRKGRTLTPGGGGTWKSGTFTWPLWGVPVACHVVRALQAAVPRDADALQRWRPPSGVFRVLTSVVSRSGQGGYGTIRPPRVIWEAPPTDLVRVGGTSRSTTTAFGTSPM